MHVRIALAAAALAIPAFAGVAAAAPALGKATGDVTFSQSSPEEAISFNAHDLGDTGDKGQITYTNVSRGFTYTADVINAEVNNEAKTACFTYVIPANSDAPDDIEGFVITFHVSDGGTPGTEGDKIGYTVGTNCAVAAGEATLVTGGNLVGHKAI